MQNKRKLTFNQFHSVKAKVHENPKTFKSYGDLIKVQFTANVKSFPKTRTKWIKSNVLNHFNTVFLKLFSLYNKIEKLSIQHYFSLNFITFYCRLTAV